MLCTHPTRQAQRRPVRCSVQGAPSGAEGSLFDGEVLLTDAVPVHGWRYECAEVAYERKTLLLGGPLLFALTGIISALRNRRARKTAASQAAAQWRPLGPLTVLATTDRLLIWHQNAYWSVWFSAIERATCDGQQLHLQFHDAAPYLLAGEVFELAKTINMARSDDT